VIELWYCEYPELMAAYLNNTPTAQLAAQYVHYAIALLSSSNRLRPTALLWYNVHVSIRLTVPSKGVSRTSQRLRSRLLP